MDQKSQELWNKLLYAFSIQYSNLSLDYYFSDDKKKARLNLLRFILSKVEYSNKKTGDFSKIDAKLVCSGEEEIRKMEANLEKLDSKKADEKIKDLD
ncbi:hypothetical protein ACFZWW_001341 [Campylobacter jejuni]|nr:polyphosphate kinase [Campylobacter jejuni subsp. doylei]VEJ47125.1 polyphosphate kinase [Campylobacter jejuni subsp. doylei]